MKSIQTILILILFLVQAANAQEVLITLDGEAYTKRYSAYPNNQDGLIELIRESETFDDWTKIVSVRYQRLPHINNDPKLAALGLAQIVKKSNPASSSNVFVNEEADEAIIDFLTSSSDGKFVEFNVFRYVRSRGSNGVVYLQFARRFPSGTAPGIDQFAALRNSWVTQISAYDMGVVQELLGK